MTTRQNEVRRILQKLNGHAPDDATVAQMANIAEAAEIMPGDALFPLMVAMDYYRVTYEAVPERIKEASAFVLREHAEAFRAEAGKITEEQKAILGEVTTKLLTTSSHWLQQNMPGIIQDEIEKAATLAVREPVQAAAERFEKVTLVAERATEKLRAAEQYSVTKWGLAVVIAAVIGGAFGGGVVAWASKHPGTPELTKEQQTALQYGKAVNKVWGELPHQSQKAIKDAVSEKGGE